VTLDPDGHVAEARIKSGESPWAESVIQALRTWRFSPVDGPGGLAFEVKAEFASAGKGGPHVDLRLSGQRRIEAPAVAEASPTPVATPPAGSAVSPAPITDATPLPSPVPPATMNPPSAAPSPAPAAPSPAPAAPAAPTPAPPSTPSPAPAVRRPAAPPEELIRNPAGGKPAPSPAGPPPTTGTSPASGIAGATVSPAPEVPATPAPTTPGISAVRDVTLAPGVPDLVKGRRPMAPPLARMQGVSGTVDVHFAVDAAGSATVREVAGPDTLKEAARQTVASWSFRRSTPERLFLAATFTYKGDIASAAVRAQE
jgi:outer membrane biosynthesis protein TonB